MNPDTLEMLRAAEEAVTRLVEHCGKTGPLYQRSPRAVAQLSRTGKWLLNVVATLRNAVPATEAQQAQQ